MGLGDHRMGSSLQPPGLQCCREETAVTKVRIKPHPECLALAKAERTLVVCMVIPDDYQLCTVPYYNCITISVIENDSAIN